MNGDNREFKCLGIDCPNHCCGAFGGISDKISIIGNRSFSDIVLTDQDVKNLEEFGAKEYITKDENNGSWKMKTLEDGTCTALDEGRCNVYPARPALCKAFPLYLDMFGGLCHINECLACDNQNSLTANKEAVESLLDIYQYWIDYYRKTLI